MQGAQPSYPMKRNFRLSPHESLFDPGAWFEDDSFATQVLNAYTLLIPEGERFIIRTCRAWLHRASPALQEELQGLFFQEAGHSREHRRVVDAMREQSLGLDFFQARVSWLSHRLLEPLFPAIVRLSTASAIEHHNAAIAGWFLDRDLMRGARAGELRRMFVWHFAEEIEHKTTVFELLQSVSPAWWLRLTGLVFSVLTFLLYTGVGTLLLGVKTRSAMRLKYWREMATFVLHRDGLPATLAIASVRYLRPGFRPLREETQPVLDAALAELALLGVERPNAGLGTTARALPAAYGEKLAPFQARLRATQRRHRFFFSRIDGYDRAWVHSDGRRLLNFCTYSYLGLLHHPRVQAAARSAVEHYGTGTHGVRLLGGNLEVHEDLESRIARFFGREAAITFSSGFMTNLAVIATLVGEGGYVLSDERNHASIIDGCRFSGAEVLRFRHSDPCDLARKLASIPESACKLIVVDAVYSMDGDVTPLVELIAVRDRHPNTLLMVDEAHSLGVLGRRGRGTEEQFDCHGQIDVLMGTLSKTIPAQGGYIAGSGELIDYLRYNARGFIFSAALSPAASAAALAALEVLHCEGEERRKRLMSNVRYFIARLREQGFDVGDTETAIVPILLESEAHAFEMARHCHLNGVFAMPVVYPAVAAGTERLRMNVTSEHRRADLDFAVRRLVEARQSTATRPSA